MGQNLVEGLLAEAAKLREFIGELDETAEVMHGEGKTAEDDPGLRASKAFAQGQIRGIEMAIGSGDVVQMVQVAKTLGLGS